MRFFVQSSGVGSAVFFSFRFLSRSLVARTRQPPPSATYVRKSVVAMSINIGGEKGSREIITASGNAMDSGRHSENTMKGIVNRRSPSFHVLRRRLPFNSGQPSPQPRNNATETGAASASDFHPHCTFTAMMKSRRCQCRNWRRRAIGTKYRMIAW